MLINNLTLSYHLTECNNIIDRFSVFFQNRILNCRQITRIKWPIHSELSSNKFQDYYDILIWKPVNSDGTVILSNCRDDLERFLYKCSAMWLVLAIKNYADNKEFEVISKQEYLRLVSITKNQKWHYFEKGKPLEYEVLQNYLKRNKKDRLPDETLSYYLEINGCNMHSDSFLACDGNGFHFQLAKHSSNDEEPLITEENGNYYVKDPIVQELRMLLNDKIDSVPINYRGKWLAITIDDYKSEKFK